VRDFGASNWEILGLLLGIFAKVNLKGLFAKIGAIYEPLGSDGGSK
jgi:hypothetical protein